MKRKNTVLLIAAMVFTTGILVPAAETQMPREINFQGRLLDSDGNPATGTAEITFRIYNAETEGDIIVIHPETVTIDDEGFYQTTIDLTGIDDFDRPLYLSVQVDGDDEMSPRLQMLPSATAIYASYAAESSTASYALYAATASFMLGHISTAAYSHNAATATYALHAATASHLLGDIDTALFANEASTASYSLKAATASYADYSYQAGYSLISATANYALSAATASFLLGEVSTAAYSHMSATAAYSMHAATASYSLYSGTASFAYSSSLLGGKSYEAFLSTSGGQLGGDIDMDSHNIANVSSISSPDLVTIIASTVAVNGDFVLKEPPGGDDLELIFRVNIDTMSAPGRAGILGTDSKWNVYISTGSEEGQWSRLNNP